MAKSTKDDNLEISVEAKVELDRDKAQEQLNKGKPLTVNANIDLEDTKKKIKSSPVELDISKKSIDRTVKTIKNTVNNSIGENEKTRNYINTISSTFKNKIKSGDYDVKKNVDDADAMAVALNTVSNDITTRINDKEVLSLKNFEVKTHQQAKTVLDSLENELQKSIDYINSGAELTEEFSDRFKMLMLASTEVLSSPRSKATNLQSYIDEMNSGVVSSSGAVPDKAVQSESKIVSEKKEDEQVSANINVQAEKEKQQTEEIVEQRQKLVNVLQNQLDAMQKVQQSDSGEKTNKFSTTFSKDSDGLDENKVLEKKKSLVKSIQDIINKNDTINFDSELSVLNDENSSVEQLEALHSQVADKVKQRVKIEKEELEIEKQISAAKERTAVKVESDYYKQQADDIKQATADAKAYYEEQVKIEKQNKAAEIKTTKTQNSAYGLAESVEKYVHNYEGDINKNKEFAASLEDIKQRAYGLATQSDVTSEDVDKLAQEFHVVKKRGDELGVTTMSVSTRLKDLFGKHLATAVTMVGVHLLSNSFNQLLSNVIEVDSAMTQLQIVTQKSDKAMQSYAKSAAEVAKNLGVSVTEVMNSTETYARLGNSLEDSLDMAGITAKFSRVADISTDDATTSLTAIMKSFDVDVDDLETVTDKLMKVSKDFPIDAAGLGTALENGGAALKTAGNDLNESVALIAAANAAVQDPSSVGKKLPIYTEMYIEQIAI